MDTIERPSTAPKGDDIQIESPKVTTEDRPADGPFRREHFAALAVEWERMRKLPDDTSWNMDYFQWNGVAAALRLAAGDVDVGGLGADWTPEMKGRALAMISILANTPPTDWRSRSEIHAGLAEFRANQSSSAETKP